MWNSETDRRQLRVRAAAIAALAGLFSLGCGSDDANEPSGGLTTGGSGGKGGSGGQGISVGGGSGGMGGSGGSAITLHSCPAAAQSCTEKVLSGDFDTAMGNTLDELAGVTEVQGNLTISGDYTFDGLECLRKVGGNVAISSADDDKSLYGLRSLTEVGGTLSLGSVFDRMYLDCALSNLAIVGANIELDGVRNAQLDLSKLSEFQGVHLTGTHVAHLVLPNSGAFGDVSLYIVQDSDLTEISGFDGVTLTPGSQYAKALRLVDNPLLSTCRANELGALFTAAGYSASSIEISGNAMDCP